VQTPDGVRFLEGDDLQPYKVPDSGLCWWCGSTADSREHKFKRTDLTRMWGNEDHLVWICNQEQVKIRSARKSSIVKFTANMCASCNNSRSQPFDVAYDKFADYVWDNLDNLWRSRFLDMRRVYGGDWQESSLNLARYFAKQLACRIDDAGFQVPSIIPPFLNGQPLLSNVQMALFKDRELWNFYCQGKSEGSATAGLFLSPALGAVSKSQRRLTMFSSSAVIGYIGVMYRWDDAVAGSDPFYVYRKARLHLREDLPEILARGR
jgi:hypothetical protein